MKFSKSFTLYLVQNVIIYKYIISQGTKLTAQFESIFPKNSFPNSVIKDLSLYFKYNLKNNHLTSARKLIIFIIFIELSQQLLEKYVENDNNKIAFNLRRLIYYINKYSLKKKKIFFLEFLYELNKTANKRKKIFYNIYNELFNDYKKKEFKLNELEYKYNKSEEKLCTFSPRINCDNNTIKKKYLKKENKNKSYEIKNKDYLNEYLYRNNNNIKYSTIDNDNKIIFNLVNGCKMNNITNNNLYNMKYINHKNNYKNYFLLNSSRNNDNIKYKTLENENYEINNKKNRSYRNKISNNFGLLKELSSEKNNKKSQVYYLTKKENNIYNADNKKTIDYAESIMKNIYDKNYNTINILEKDNRNILENNINKNIKLNSIKYSHSNKEKIKYSSSYKKNKAKDEFNQKDYYYSFRKKKLHYNNSFNTSSKKSIKNLIPNNDSKLSKKNKKNKIPISLRDNTKFKSLNDINKIYSNNYNNKISRIQKYEQDINTNNNSFNNRNIKLNKNKFSFLDLTSKKESTRQQSNTNINTNNNETKLYSASSFSLNNPSNIKSNREIIKELTYSSNNTDKKSNEKNIINKKLELNYYQRNIKEENKQSEVGGRKGYKNIKSEKSMTLQSLSDSKMLELAEHYINNSEDSFEVLDLKYLELKKNLKKEKERRDITFG